jgi:hypothetical protein
MKTLIWKLRFTFAIRRLLNTPWALSWSMADSNFENLHGDLTECPINAAEEERAEWFRCSE